MYGDMFVQNFVDQQASPKRISLLLSALGFGVNFFAVFADNIYVEMMNHSSMTRNYDYMFHQ